MTEALHVAAFTQGLEVPSARFRVRQFIEPLHLDDVEVHEWPSVHGAYPPTGLVARLAWLPYAWHERRHAIDEARNCSVALFQREQISTLGGVELRWNKPAVLDVDDAIWLSQRWGSVDRLARRIGMVLCGNSFIADHFAPLASVHILPTAVDTTRYCPGGDTTDDFPVMVWSGSASGLPYLQDIETALARVLDAVPHARLRVVCNVAPRLSRLPVSRVDFVPWHPDTEVASLQSATVGLMPMPDSPWTQGKCSFKMLTYMACGLPVVVSPYGMNAEVLAQGDVGIGAQGQDDWADALIGLLRDDTVARRLGRQGRHLANSRYATAVVAPQLAALLRMRAAG